MRLRVRDGRPGALQGARSRCPGAQVSMWVPEKCRNTPRGGCTFLIACCHLWPCEDAVVAHWRGHAGGTSELSQLLVDPSRLLVARRDSRRADRR